MIAEPNHRISHRTASDEMPPARPSNHALSHNITGIASGRFTGRRAGMTMDVVSSDAIRRRMRSDPSDQTIFGSIAHEDDDGVGPGRGSP
jgi:hypothetical protein